MKVNPKIKAKAVIVEVLEDSENGQCTYIVRDIPSQNAPAATLAVCQTPDELAQFFCNFEIEG